MKKIVKNKTVTVNKNDLPQKTCATCGRPFTWRKKWERDWENVKFCSDKCRQSSKDKMSN